MGPLAPTINEYYPGNRVRCSVDPTKPFAIAGVATDPDTVTFTYRRPNGVEAVLVYNVDGAVKRASVGVYYVDLLLDTPGRWWYGFKGTGNMEAAQEQMIYVATTQL